MHLNVEVSDDVDKRNDGRLIALSLPDRLSIRNDLELRPNGLVHQLIALGQVAVLAARELDDVLRHLRDQLEEVVGRLVAVADLPSLLPDARL